MIKGNELRAGNLLFTATNEVAVFKAAWEEGIACILESDPAVLYFYPEGLFPISVSEEWLLKFGFEDSKRSYCLEFNIGLICFLFDKETKSCHLYFGNEKNPVCAVEYVHHLQNLYFSLTSQELTKN